MAKRHPFRFRVTGAQRAVRRQRPAHAILLVAGDAADDQRAAGADEPGQHAGRAAGQRRVDVGEHHRRGFEDGAAHVRPAHLDDVLDGVQADVGARGLDGVGVDVDGKDAARSPQRRRNGEHPRAGAEIEHVALLERQGLQRAQA